MVFVAAQCPKHVVSHDFGQRFVDLVLGLVSRGKEPDHCFYGRAAGFAAGQLSNDDRPLVVGSQYVAHPRSDLGGRRSVRPWGSKSGKVHHHVAITSVE